MGRASDAAGRRRPPTALTPRAPPAAGIIHFDRHADIQETDLDERMHTTPYFHATAIPNVRPENLVQIGIGGWQARRAPRGARSSHAVHTHTRCSPPLSCAPSQVPRAAVPIMRDRRTNIFSVADVEDLGPDKVIERGRFECRVACRASPISRPALPILSVSR